MRYYGYLTGVLGIVASLPLWSQVPPETPLVLYGRIESSLPGGGLVTSGEVTLVITDVVKGAVQPITVPAGNIGNQFSYRANIPLAVDPTPGFVSPGVAYSVGITYRGTGPNQEPVEVMPDPAMLTAQRGMLMELTPVRAPVDPDPRIPPIEDICGPLGHRSDGKIDAHDLLCLLENLQGSRQKNGLEDLLGTAVLWQTEQSPPESR